MSFKELTLVFKVGRFLALTPSSVQPKSNTVLQKLYTLLICTLITLAVIGSATYKKFYSQFIHIKVAVCLLSDSLLFSLIIYTMIVQGFYRRKVWNDFIDILKRTEHLTKTQNLNKIVPYYFEFLAVNLIHLIFATYVVAIWSEINGMRFLREEGITVIQVYLKLFCKYILYVLLKMLLIRYRGLKNVLLLSLEQIIRNLKSNWSDETVLQLVKNVQLLMCVLKKSVDIFNAMFGWPLFFIISFTTIEIMNTIDDALFHSSELGLFHMILMNVASVGWTFVGTVALILKCQALYQEAEEIVSLSYQLQLLCTDNSVNENLKIRQFPNFVIKNLPKFSAANFFLVDKSTILSMLATLGTFLIIMVQFSSK
ncbi:hypothetical protein Zmor_018233 [Zophobas morio]|uniref:Gustatory receptor n=1 Tax=Zophobas morio TaxID=2755281 RepID=A0AA38MDC1_9CUCU|nr:hypothetical protein Zmor_018233 [Zophobas morio]